MTTETKTQSTPGPWKVGNCKNMSFPIIPDCRSPIALAFTAYNGLPIETDRANARLIAQAPALLNALEVAEATINRLERHAPGSANGTLDVIRAAIAEAT